MIIVVLALLGLCLGSFINALVWRLHEQAEQVDGHSEHSGEQDKPGKLTKKGKQRFDKKYLARLSIISGHSMCPSCKHALAGKDLLPVVSWLSLSGRCRYCRKPISWQYPLVEVLTAGLFIVSYIYWPQMLGDGNTGGGLLTAARLQFGLWLLLLTGFLALVIYDLRWLLLPNRIVYPLLGIALLSALTGIIAADRPLSALFNVLLAVAVGGGLFYVLYQVSSGKWIGGGDVKLGWLLGLLVATPVRAFLLIFIAALAGTIVSVPLLAAARLKRTSTIPFGPFLIIAAIVVVLFGTPILHWYQRLVLY
jgi:prepilin signal peptidase PulO-like enzyme (type II secretory pathway)